MEINDLMHANFVRGALNEAYRRLRDDFNMMADEMDDFVFTFSDRLMAAGVDNDFVLDQMLVKLSTLQDDIITYLNHEIAATQKMVADDDCYVSKLKRVK